MALLEGLPSDCKCEKADSQKAHCCGSIWCGDSARRCQSPSLRNASILGQRFQREGSCHGFDPTTIGYNQCGLLRSYSLQRQWRFADDTLVIVQSRVGLEE